MSHGPSGGDGVKSDPNLTPLLDVVLQLLMFFMMCVNFVTEQVNKNVDLPVAESAVPMDKSESEASVLFLNLNRNGHLEIPGHPDPMRNPFEMRFYIKSQYSDAQDLDRQKGGQGDVKTTVIIRADRNCNYAEVYRLLKICQEVGYTKLQVRALTKSTKDHGGQSRSTSE
ncbi:MAG: ExbD/TolR family protein [Gemmataceae bacterium]